MQNKCSWCRGKFGLVRYYHFRIGFCRKVCRAKYQASWERKKLLRRLIPHRAAIPASSARHRRSQRFLIMLPYLLALLAMGGLVGRQMAPATLGKPYRR